ncbi:DnaB-like helicase C-terminal domain-containing protein [Clostridium sp.]|uniref:DnaB-like helicase C-terminal domain-containing protein n=1 Tax=Clostridium sp. TaxID=1506 RepID=UPI002906484A|nr:DnaB-like helicase C-terminal domain-containing protein [Clostridium sp.]MDU4479895.1 DnaB-like helicase C-terminal domain-containing protein [Clostridium sp.]
MDRFNIDIEKALLGNCIKSKENFVKLLDRGVTTEDFYNTRNQNVFNSLLECYSSKNTTDPLIVAKIAVKYKVLPSYITELVAETIDYSDLSAYINELLNLRIVRERLKLAQDIQAGNITTDEDIKKRFENIDFIKSKIGDTNTITTLDKVRIVDIHSMEKISTGFNKIDEKLLGFVMGSLNIITGYNGNGKSTFLNQMCIAESLSQGYKVFAYSPELTNSNLKSWLYPTIANSEHFIEKTYMNGKYKTIGSIGVKYIDKWIKDKLFVYTDDSLTTDEEQLLLDMNTMAKQGVKVFIIDNLMKIDLKDSYKNEYMAQKIFVNKLKNFARKYGVVVHLVAHPRKPQQGNSKVTKFDVAGTGDITNLADYAIAIKKNSEKEKKNDSTLKDAYVEVLKDRMRGYEFGVDLNFCKYRRRFYTDNYELNKDYGYLDKEELVQVECQENIF